MRSKTLTRVAGPPDFCSQMYGGSVFAGSIARHRRGLGFVARVGDAVPLIEPLVDRRASVDPVRAAQVPLAEQCRRVAGRPEHLGDGDLPLGDARGLRSRRSNRVAARQQRRPGHGARKLDVEVVEPYAARRDAVDIGRRHAAHAAVDADLAPAQVVGEHQDDVGTTRAGSGQCRRRRYGSKHDDRTRNPSDLHWSSHGATPRIRIVDRIRGVVPRVPLTPSILGLSQRLLRPSAQTAIRAPAPAESSRRSAGDRRTRSAASARRTSRRSPCGYLRSPACR